MSTPSISVVLPAYNHAGYVGAAIDSVLAQTWQDFELIVIDDASTDATWEVISEFDDARLRVRRNAANLGAHATLNLAIGEARGDQVAILNSDDLFAPDRLERCRAALAAAGADLLGSGITLIDAAGDEIREHWWLDAYRELLRRHRESGDWVATLLAGNVLITTSNFFFRRTLWEDIGGFSDYRYVHDYDFLLRVLAAGKRLALIEDGLLRYRLHAANTISDQPLRANLECAAMLRAALPALCDRHACTGGRLAALAGQWARLENYIIEITAAQRHEALVAQEAVYTRLVEDRDRWIAERDGWIAERDGWVADRDRWIVERDGWIAERDALLVGRDAVIADLRARIATTDEALATSRAELERLHGSHSLRLGRTLLGPASGLRQWWQRWRGRR